MIDRSGPLPNAIAERASRWFTRRQRGLTAREEADFKRWFEKDDRHRLAYARLESAWQQSGILSSGGLARDRALPRAPCYMRHTTHVAGTSAALALLLGISIVTFRPQIERFIAGTPAEAAVYETAIGELRHVTLATGTKITLDTQSRLYVADTGDLVLERGRARFTLSGSEASARVSAGSVVVTGKGAIFDIDIAAVPTRVTNLRGDLEVQAGAASRRHVAAGSRIDLRGAGIITPITTDETHWVDGMIAFNATALGDAIAAMNRYNRTQVRLDDAPARLRTISGAFKATDPIGFANSLARLYPLNVDRSTPGLIILTGSR